MAISTKTLADITPEVWRNVVLAGLRKDLVGELVCNKNFKQEFWGKGDTLNISSMGTLTDNQYDDDNITYDTTPSFWGYAEADTIVYVYADLDDDDVLELDTDLLLGKTVAIPLDGTNQFPNGQWNMTTNVDMNDPAYFPVIDGTRTIFILTEDIAGNVSDAWPSSGLTSRPAPPRHGPQRCSPNS